MAVTGAVNFCSQNQGQKLPASNPGGMLHIELHPASPAGVAVQAAAKRILMGVLVQYQPSGLVARKLQMQPRTLGRVTGSLWVRTEEERIDLGLCVKHAAKDMCVPDYVQPMSERAGWAYSQALVAVLEQYKRRFPWVFAMVEHQQETSDFELGEVLPGVEAEAALQKVREAKKWISTLPLSKRPLVKTSSRVAPEDAIRALQASLPPNLAKPQQPLELENVSPQLLVAPVERGMLTLAVAGGNLELGDRTPTFGARGTVVGVHDDAIEVLCDATFIGGTTLHGRCNGNCGTMLLREHLLNLSKPQPVALPGEWLLPLEDEQPLLQATLGDLCR
eukprot:jgi/Astpho2/603/Aster-x0943